MRVMVTGGAGYIGGVVVQELLADGQEVVVYDNLTKGHRAAVSPGAELVEGDLADGDLLACTLRDRGIECVVHMASFIEAGESVVNPAKYFRNNIMYCINLLEAMVATGVSRFVFSSSAAVYGDPGRIPIEEDAPVHPTNPYGETKLMFEKILKWYDVAYGIKSVSLRYFNAAGADPDGEIGEDHTPEGHIIPIILQTLLGQRDSVKVFGCDWDTPDGTCLRDYIHVTDLADAHLKALGALERGAETTAYNLGNGDGQSVKQMIDAAEDVTGKKVPWVAAPRRPGDPAKLVASSVKLQRELGWKPKYPGVRTIIEHAWRWHSTHPQGYAR